MQAAAALAESTGSLEWSAAAPIAAVLGIAELVASQYYELRLAPERDQIDYLAAFSRHRAAELRAKVSAALAQRAEFRSPGWLAIERLLAGWAGDTSSVAARASCVWFELDDFQRQPMAAVPSISVCLLPEYRIQDIAGGPAAEDLRLARELLDLLAAPPAVGAVLERVFAALPAGARWIHLSSMLGRARQATKLYGVFPRRELLPYLERVGWAGSMSVVAAALEQLYPERLLGDELYLDLNLDDFQDSERCTLGLAVAQQHLLRGPDSDPTRQAILDVWERAGLCDPAKSEMARDWPLSSPARRGPFVREIRYLDVKLVWRESAWQAKAYVGRHLRRLF